MKIVFVGMTMGKGGAERVISTLCNRWKRTEDELCIVTCLDGDSSYPLREGVTHQSLIPASDYYTLGKKKTLGPIIRRYREAMKELKPDLIITFLTEPCIVAALSKRHVKAKVIGSERSNPYYQYRSRLMKTAVNWAYGKLDGFVFQTKGAKAFFGKKVQKKSVVIGNPVNESVSALQATRRNPTELVAVGRFTPEKNYPMLIEAMERVVAAGQRPMLHIYGRVEEKLGIGALIAEKNLENYVVFEGERDDVHQKIRDAGLFLLPSKSEGQPNALMEAMAMGMAVVATDCPSGGPAELIRNGVNGLLVENENAQAFAEAILRLLTHPEEAESMGKQARKTMEAYTVDAICDRWSQYIEDVLA